MALDTSRRQEPNCDSKASSRRPDPDAIAAKKPTFKGKREETP
jgi:hypothetical protein